ncbi:MAG TPA: type II toxin-antitoxin system PemK/MazF family toxin [Bryobacterales bacterium]|nr:type II toxin-antitoxin system PemK/MazF family toxin [Bryobacterales bacterium]
MSLHRGDVVLVRVSFHQEAGSKVRPAVAVLAGNDDDFVAAPITSRAGRSELDLALTDWSAAGLNVPSFARIHKLATLHKPDVLRVIGRLSDPDLQKLHDTLCKAYCPARAS